MGRTSGGSGGGGGPAYQTLTAEPTAVVPASIGQLGVDTTNGALYIAYGTSAGDWLTVGGVDTMQTLPGATGIGGGGGRAQLAFGLNDFLYFAASYMIVYLGGSPVFGSDGGSFELALALNTATVATVSTQSFSTGSAFTPNANGDCLLTGWIGHAGTLTITMGPTTGAENTLWSAVAVLADSPISWWVPAGWLCVITLASSATVTNLHKTLI